MTTITSRKRFQLGLLMGFMGSVFAQWMTAAPACAEEPRWAVPPLGHCISIRDGRTDQRMSLEALVTDLSKADVVFLGESHTDETTHRLQLKIFEALLRRKQNKVVLAMEMFERDVQQRLDRYLAEEIDEATFLEEARPWQNYREAYRPLVEAAKRAKVPVLASNFPGSLRRKFAMEGEEALASLSESERQLVPKQFLPNSLAYWRRVDNAIRGHQGMMPTSKSDDSRLYSTQSLWDNAMGESCADALEEHPGHTVLHLNGGFHSAYFDGTAHQLRLRKPKAKVKTIAIHPVLNPASARLRGLPVADYAVFVESRATNLDQGKRTVQISGDLEYLFHVPKSSTDQTPLPLLIWLPDRGLTAKESLKYCKSLLGNEVAIAVIQPPYRETGPDLSLGGRWYWPDSFAGDVGTMVGGVERIWSYLMSHYDLDGEQVCVAGEGTGATLATIIATHSSRMPHRAIALQPSRYAKLKDLPLLLPESFGKDRLPQRSLSVIATNSQQSWWDAELEQYRSVEVNSVFHLTKDDPWNHQSQQISALRAALGLSEQVESLGDERHYLLVDHDSPRGRLWGKLQASWHQSATGIPTVALKQMDEEIQASKLPTVISPAKMAEKGILPRCPGAFGGTTVLIVPAETSVEDLATWKALEENDPLAAQSRFHRLRIATSAGPQALAPVLQKLLGENRKNVLLVPAVFHAEAAWMRALASETTDFQDKMTIHWLPGLGGRKGILAE